MKQKASTISEAVASAGGGVLAEESTSTTSADSNILIYDLPLGESEHGMAL